MSADKTGNSLILAVTLKRPRQVRASTPLAYGLAKSPPRQNNPTGRF